MIGLDLKVAFEYGQKLRCQQVLGFQICLTSLQITDAFWNHIQQCFCCHPREFCWHILLMQMKYWKVEIQLSILRFFLSHQIRDFVKRIYLYPSKILLIPGSTKWVSESLNYEKEEWGFMVNLWGRWRCWSGEARQRREYPCLYREPHPRRTDRRQVWTFPPCKCLCLRGGALTWGTPQLCT